MFFSANCYFFGYFSRYIVDLLDSVDTVVDNQSVVAFSQSASEIQTKWLTTRDEIVTLKLTESSDLTNQAEISFYGKTCSHNQY